MVSVKSILKWPRADCIARTVVIPQIGVLSLYLAACAVSGLRGLRRMLMLPIRLMAKDYQSLWLSLLKKPISFLAKAEANAVAHTCDSSSRNIARLTTIAATRCFGHLVSIAYSCTINTCPCSRLPSLLLQLPAGSSAVLAGLAVLAGSSTFTASTIAVALASYLIGRAYSASEGLPKFMSVLLAGPL